MTASDDKIKVSWDVLRKRSDVVVDDQRVTLLGQQTTLEGAKAASEAYAKPHLLKQ